MEDSFSYEAGYNLQTMALALIIFTCTFLVEILRYSKTAIEFMLSVVVVEAPLLGADHAPFDLEFSKERGVHWPSISWLQASRDLDADHKCVKARGDLGECIRQSRDFLEFLENAAVKDKISSRVKSELERCLSCTKILVDSNTDSSSNDLKTALKALKKVVTISMAKISPAGLYFPIDADLKPFPQKSMFQQICDLLFESGSDDSKCTIWWDKRMYANDTSGWIIRRSENGWEMVPCVAWRGCPTFFVEGLSAHPPASGWKPWESSSTSEMMLRSPFRFNFCRKRQPHKHSTAFFDSNLTTKLLPGEHGHPITLTNVLGAPRSSSCKFPAAPTDLLSVKQPSVELRRSWAAGAGSSDGNESVPSFGSSGEQEKAVLGQDGAQDGKRAIVGVTSLEEKRSFLTKTEIALFERDAEIINLRTANAKLQSEASGKKAALMKNKIALDKRDAEINNLHTAIDKLQSDKNAALTKKETALHEKDAEINNLRTTVVKLQSEASRLQSDQKTALAKREMALHERNAEIINLRAAISKLQGSMENLE